MFNVCLIEAKWSWKVYYIANTLCTADETHILNSVYRILLLKLCIVMNDLSVLSSHTEK